MATLRDDPLGLPTEWLDETPFRDYFVPGAVLFSLFGLGSVVALVGIARRRAWAATAAIALGVAQVGWIVAEMLLLRAIHPLHVLYGGLGAALAVLASRPSVREYFHVAPSE